uniref:Transmembrane protein n=1 Tax=Alexandrium catenella TaxID=2925 RepID=A0A7S1WIZ2_ALECA|mmetsp:Transcript_65637/g.174844  ORF Transcript_65637/g.174844 Transcript_65637/m.174844 type:complete len:222 (+) Transcript_65637:120-785(+)
MAMLTCPRGAVLRFILLLLPSLTRNIVAERVSTLPTVGAAAKLANSAIKTTSDGDDLLQDAFADLQDEFDHLPQSGNIGSPAGSLMTPRAALLMLSVAFAGCAAALWGFQRSFVPEVEDTTFAHEAEVALVGAGGSNMVAGANKEDNPAQLRQLQEELQTLPSLSSQREVEDDDAALEQELESARSHECEVARGKEYEDAMDDVYDSLFEQLLLAEGLPQK